MVDTEKKPTGILLAGGKSSRMQSILPKGIINKSFLPLGGKPLLLHVLERIQPQVNPLIINANSSIEHFSSFGLPIVQDSFNEFAGPLAGVLVGMMWAKKHNPASSYIITVSTDVPFIPLDLVERLQTSLVKKKDNIVLTRSNGKIHPVIGLWPISLRNILEEALKTGIRKMLDWTNIQETLYVDFPLFELNGEFIDPFFNINTPEDLERAEEIIKITKSKQEK